MEKFTFFCLSFPFRFRCVPVSFLFRFRLHRALRDISAGAGLRTLRVVNFQLRTLILHLCDSTVCLSVTLCDSTTFAMVFSDYTKHRILILEKDGHSPRKIAQLLADEGLSVSATGVYKFLKRYRSTNSIQRSKGSGGKRKISPEIEQLVEQQMRADDETTATQLQSILCQQGHQLSLSTILRCRTQLGWTYRGSAYCQVIRTANKMKRLDWARRNVGGNFSNVVFTDECSIQMETHRRFCCHKRGELPKNKPRQALQ